MTRKFLFLSFSTWIVTMPLCAHVSKLFSFRHFRLQEYLEQQENTFLAEEWFVG